MGVNHGVSTEGVWKQYWGEHFDLREREPNSREEKTSDEALHKFKADQIKKRDWDVKYSKHSMRNAYKTLAGKPEECKSLCIYRGLLWKIILNLILKKLCG